MTQNKWRGVKEVNKAKLEYEMNIHNISKGEMCAKLGISRSAFYRKCNGESEFTQGEIQKIIDILGLESPMGIFFNENVSFRTR